MPSIREKSVSGRARDLATAVWPPACAVTEESRGVDARVATIIPADTTTVSSKIRAGAFNNFWRNISYWNPATEKRSIIDKDQADESIFSSDTAACNCRASSFRPLL
jgi:hypothetical protein